MQRKTGGESMTWTIAKRAGYEDRRRAWFELLDEWRARHLNITTEQALSILFDDSAFNPDSKEHDRIQRKNLIWAEADDFAMDYANGEME
jgi:hypothetical protein